MWKMRMSNSSHKFCYGCSCELQMCYFCNEPIREGSSYLENIEKKVQKFLHELDLQHENKERASLLGIIEPNFEDDIQKDCENLVQLNMI